MAAANLLRKAVWLTEQKAVDHLMALDFRMSLDNIHFIRNTNIAPELEEAINQVRVHRDSLRIAAVSMSLHQIVNFSSVLNDIEAAVAFCSAPEFTTKDLKASIESIMSSDVGRAVEAVARRMQQESALERVGHGHQEEGAVISAGGAAESTDASSERSGALNLSAVNAGQNLADDFRGQLRTQLQNSSRPTTVASATTDSGSGATIGTSVPAVCKDEEVAESWAGKVSLSSRTSDRSVSTPLAAALSPSRLTREETSVYMEAVKNRLAMRAMGGAAQFVEVSAAPTLTPLASTGQQHQSSSIPSSTVSIGGSAQPNVSIGSAQPDVMPSLKEQLERVEQRRANLEVEATIAPVPGRSGDSASLPTMIQQQAEKSSLRQSPVPSTTIATASQPVKLKQSDSQDHISDDHQKASVAVIQPSTDLMSPGGNFRDQLKARLASRGSRSDTTTVPPPLLPSLEPTAAKISATNGHIESSYSDPESRTSAPSSGLEESMSILAPSDCVYSPMVDRSLLDEAVSYMDSSLKGGDAELASLSAAFGRDTDGENSIVSVMENPMHKMFRKASSQQADGSTLPALDTEIHVRDTGKTTALHVEPQSFPPPDRLVTSSELGEYPQEEVYPEYQTSSDSLELGDESQSEPIIISGGVKSFPVSDSASMDMVTGVVAPSMVSDRESPLITAAFEATSAGAAAALSPSLFPSPAVAAPVTDVGETVHNEDGLSAKERLMLRMKNRSK